MPPLRSAHRRRWRDQNTMHNAMLAGARTLLSGCPPSSLGRRRLRRLRCVPQPAAQLSTSLARARLSGWRGHIRLRPPRACWRTRAGSDDVSSLSLSFSLSVLLVLHVAFLLHVVCVLPEVPAVPRAALPLSLLPTELCPACLLSTVCSLPACLWAHLLPSTPCPLPSPLSPLPSALMCCGQAHRESRDSQVGW